MFHMASIFHMCFTSISCAFHAHFTCLLLVVSMICSNFFRFLAARGKIYKFLRLLAVEFSTSCGFLRLDFQLLAFRMFLRINRKNKTFLRLAAAYVFLRFFLTTTSLFHSLNIQVSHHLQIARLIEAGGVRTA